MTMNTIPTFQNPGTAELMTTPLKGLLHICREHHHEVLREAIAHCDSAPIKYAIRRDIIVSALKRRAFKRM